MAKILLLDLETSPNLATVWGIWQQNIATSQLLQTSYILCWAAKWLGEEKTHFSSIHEDKDGYLIGIWELLDQADMVIHYNGANFDIPILNREFLLHDMEPPMPYKQIDLLQVVRRRFRFVSNKLDFVLTQLGFEGKVKHRGHELWLQCMNGDPDAWEEMKEYNVYDVVGLEKVYMKLRPWISNHPNLGLYDDFPYEDEETPICPNCGSRHVVKKGIERTKALTYQRYRCAECGTPIRGVKRIPGKRAHVTQIMGG